MSMTKIERLAKEQVIEILQKSGYPTYARLFKLFDLNLTEDPSVIGYMEPGKGRIVLNSGLSINQVSVIVRHEILHEYFTHGDRDSEYRKTHNKSYDHQLTNIAADYEISNRGYTDADKVTVRNIVLNNKILRGLVTEDDHKDWVDMSFEEMLDELTKEDNQIKNSNTPQIGDRGDENIQNSEEQKRQAEAEQERSEETQEQQTQRGNSSNAEQAEQNAEQAKDLADQAQEANEEAKEQKENQLNQGRVFSNNKDKQQQEELAKRIQEIQKELNEIRKSNNLIREAENNIEKEKIAKAAKDVSRYRESPNTRFAYSLNNFIKNEIATGRGKTWTRFDKRYAGTGLIRAGSSRLAQEKVPLINVYFDRSGSFSGYPEKTKGAEEAIGTLNHYVMRGQLKLKLYYVAQTVESDREVAERQGMGADGEAILEHIEATKPDNVIILTDSDASVGSGSKVKVPGAIWLLFYEDRATGLEQRFTGYKELKTFLIPYSS